MDNKPLVYLAGPFFNEKQLDLIRQLEATIEDDEGWELFSPRLSTNAIEMNDTIALGRDPSAELRQKVFNDNVNNIDNADLMIAVIDDRDTGTMFEMGYAYKAHVPIVTFTASDYGCNLMLAHSIIGHVKSIEDLAIVLDIGSPGLGFHTTVAEYGAAIATIQTKFKSLMALKEGPRG